jgi:hypothetical protein
LGIIQEARAMTTAVLSPFITCTHCKKEFPRRAARCTACHAPNLPPKRIPGTEQACFECGEPLPRRSNVCAECGFAHTPVIG